MYTCATCQKDYKVYSSYYSHLKTHDQQSYPCNKCGKEFKLKNSMKIHSYDCKAREQQQAKAEKVQEKKVDQLQNTSVSKLGTYLFPLE